MNRKLKCNVALSNLLAGATHKSERLTQLLLNDKAELLEDGTIWIFIQIQYTGTKGWVLRGQFTEIEEVAYHAVPLTITMPGDSSSGPDGFITGTFHEDLDADSRHGILLSHVSRDEATMQSILFYFLEAPYMWGGITTSGIDCSGLSMLFYRFYGVHLTAFAAAQFELGHVLDFLQDARCGDLAFFESEEEEVVHVGILLNPGEIIHATEKAGKVVIDSIDNEGIISRLSGKRTHRLRLVKRYL